MTNYPGDDRNLHFCAETIFNSVPDALIVINRDLLVISANKGFYSLFEISKEDVEQQNILDLKELRFLRSHLKQLIRSAILNNKEVENVDCGSLLFGKRYSFSIKPVIESQEPLFLFQLRADPEITAYLYKKLIENSPDVIIGTDVQGRLTYLNKNAESILGYGKDEVIGKNIIGNLVSSVQIGDQDNNDIWKLIQDNPDKTYEGTFEVVSKNGRKLYLYFHTRSFKDESCFYTDIFIEGHDITKLELTRIHLEEKKNILDSILNALPEGIIVTDENGVIQAVSKHTGEILDISVDSLVNTDERVAFSQLPIYWPDGQSRPSLDKFPLSALSLQRGEVTDYDLLFKNNGKSKNISYQASPIVDSNGMMIGAISNLRDVTVSSQLINENLSQKNLLERILDYAPFMMALFSVPDYKFVFVNNNYIRFARKQSDIIGRTLFDIWPESQKVCRTYMDEVVRTGQVSHIEDAPIEITRDKGLEILYFRTTFIPAFSPKHEIENILIIFQETTDAVQRRKMIDELLARDEALLSSMADGVMVHAVDGSLTYMNPVAKILHDFPESGENYSFELLDLDRQVLPIQRWPFSRALDGERFTGYEVIVKNKHSGREWYASYNGSPVYNDKGELLFAVVSALDITARKKAEEQVRYTQLKFQKFIDSDVVGIVVSNTTGDLIEVNDYYLKLLGYTREEFDKLKFRWNQITPPESLQRDYAAIDEYLTKGEVSPYEKQYYRKDGSLVWVLIGFVGLVRDLLLAYVIDITNQKRSEEALRKSEAQLRAVFNSVSEGIVIFDAYGKAVLANTYEAQNTGFKSPEDLINNAQDVFNRVNLYYLHGGEIPIDQWPVTRALKKEVIRDFECLVQKLGDRDQMYFTFSAEPVVDEKGNQIAVVLTSKDITRRKQVELQLRKSEERFRILFEDSPVGVTSLELHTGKYLMVNEQLTKITGYSREEHLKMTFKDITHPDDLVLDLQKYQRLVNNDIAVYENEKRYIRKDGRVIWAKITARILPEFDNEPVATIGVVLDITERKEAEKKLAEREELFRNLADNISQLAWMADKDGNFFWYNKRFYEFTGLSYEEAKGAGWKKAVHPEFLSAVSAHFEHALQKGIAVEVSFPAKDKHGNFHWFLANAIPIKDDQGKVIRWLGTNTDITESREKQSLLDKQKKTLETILDLIPQGLLVAIPPDGRIIYSSRFDKFHTGTPLKDQSKELDRIRRLNLRKDGEKIAAFEQIPFIRALQGERITDEEWILDSVQGDTLHILVSTESIRDKDGIIVGVVLAWRDISELVRQKHELQKAQHDFAFQAARYRAVFNSISEGLMIIDRDGIIKEINPAIYTIFRNISDLTDMPISEIHRIGSIFDEQNQEINVAQWPSSRVTSGEVINNQQVQLRLKDGDYYHLLISGSPVSIDGTSTFSILTFRNITKQIDTENVLRVALRKMQRFVDANIIGFVTGDFQGRVSECNDYFLKLSGFTREDLRNGNINWKKLSPPEYFDRDDAAIEEIFRRGSSTPYEKELFRKDGSRVWVILAVASTAENEIVAFILDISDRKKLEKQFEDERNFISTILSTQGAFVAIKDPEGRIIDINPAFQEMIGYSVDEVKGKSFFDFFTKGNFDFVLEQYKTVLTTNTPVILENWVTGKNGVNHFIRWRDVALRDEKGDISFVIATGIDITDRLQAENRIKKLNDELRIYTTELEYANREMESFSYSVSHDLRAPLNVIDGFSSLILEEFSTKLDDEVLGYVSKIQLNARKMNTLINDILTLSRISRADLALEKIDLSEMVSSYLYELRSSEPHRKANFSVEQGVFIQADRRLIHLAVENLLSNAWKYSSKNEMTEIQFGTLAQDGQVVYFIKDNGVGFNMKYSGKLFKPFQRLHSERDFKGTGIGLATVVRVIRRHSGKIWVESEVNKGTTFYFTLELTR